MIDAQVQTQLTDHLQPGETLTAAIWVSRPNGHQLTRITRSELTPWRIRRRAPEQRPGLNGRPQSHAVALDEHVRTVNDPRILARTDRRLLLLSQGGIDSWRDLLPRRADHPASALRLRWEGPIADLARATEQAGTLQLNFTDGSTITLLTPSAHAEPFLRA
jgi:hypothetical protein